MRGLDGSQNEIRTIGARNREPIQDQVGAVEVAAHNGRQMIVDEEPLGR